MQIGRVPCPEGEGPGRRAVLGCRRYPEELATIYIPTEILEFRSGRQ